MEQQATFDPATVLAFLFTVGAFGGLAALLRLASQQLTIRNVLSSMLNSGLLAVCLWCLWTEEYRVAGCCILAALGGTSMVEFVLEVAKRRAERSGP